MGPSWRPFLKKSTIFIGEIWENIGNMSENDMLRLYETSEQNDKIIRQTWFHWFPVSGCVEARNDAATLKKVKHFWRSPAMRRPCTEALGSWIMGTSSGSLCSAPRRRAKPSWPLTSWSRTAPVLFPTAGTCCLCIVCVCFIDTYSFILYSPNMLYTIHVISNIYTHTQIVHMYMYTHIHHTGTHRDASR